jgi:uncharacterized protein YuzE
VTIRWTFDANADAFYVYLGEGSIASQLELDEGFIADLDADGAVVGVEIIGGMRALDVNGLEALGVPEIGLTMMVVLAAQRFPSPMRQDVFTDRARPASQAGLSVEPLEPILVSLPS